MSKLPAAVFPWVFAALMAAAMTALVSALLTLLRVDASLSLWLRNWLLAWLIATPSIVWLAPRARRIAARIAVPPESTPAADQPRSIRASNPEGTSA